MARLPSPCTSAADWRSRSQQISRGMVDRAPDTSTETGTDENRDRHGHRRADRRRGAPRSPRRLRSSRRGPTVSFVRWRTRVRCSRSRARRFARLPDLLTCFGLLLSGSGASARDDGSRLRSRKLLDEPLPHPARLPCHRHGHLRGDARSRAPALQGAAGLRGAART